MRTPTRHHRSRQSSRTHYQGVTVTPDQNAGRELGLSYWEDDCLAIIAKGFVVADASASLTSQCREVQS